jgi:hypothetical protein
LVFFVGEVGSGIAKPLTLAVSPHLFNESEIIQFMSRRRLLSSRDTAAVIIAIFTLIGTLTTAYFMFRAPIAPLELSIATTQTAQALFTSTSPTATLSPTDTLIPTETLLPLPSPTLAVGEDLEISCIDSKYWTPYKGEKRPKDNRGCWDLSTMNISAQNGGLLIAADNVEGYSRSLYTTLPKNAEIQFKIRINKLSTVKVVDSSLVFGIGNADEWLSGGKFLIYRVISPNSPIYMFFADSVLSYGASDFPHYTYGQEQKIVFSINGLVLDVYVDNSKVLESIPLTQSNKKVFWIGSWVSNKGSVNLFVKDFRVIEK